MNYAELMHDRSSIERGSELIDLLQDRDSARRSFRKAESEKRTYFDDTVRRLVNSTLHGEIDHGEIDDMAYTHLGRSVIEARHIQDQYNVEDDVNEHNVILDGMNSRVMGFLRQHSDRPFAVMNIDVHNPGIFSHKETGPRHPSFAGGYYAKDESSNGDQLYLYREPSMDITRHPSDYMIRVFLNGAAPLVAFAIGD